MQKRFFQFSLIVIPFLYLFTGFHFNQIIGMFSIRNVDPEYIYFMSGLGISNGHLHLGHIDNPGTPLQYLVGLTFRLAYIFRPNDHPFMEDVFLHSDYYLNMANHFILVIVAACFFFFGREVYKITGNLAYALLIQTAPFYSEITYDIIGRLVPELLTPMPILLFSLYFLKLIYSKNADFKTKDIVFMAIICGIGLSIKLNFIALLIIPLIILPGMRKKLYFIGFSILSFFLIALPVAFDIATFFGWVKNLLVHSGGYGQGEANFINWATFASNLNEIWNSTSNLYYFLLLLGITSAIFFFFRKKTIEDNRLFLISVGVWVAIVLQIAMVSKHYSYRYLIPSLAFIPMMIILSYEMISRMYPTKWNKNIFILILFIGFVLGINKHVASAKLRTLAISNEMDPKLKTWFVAETLEKDSYKIIVSQAYGAPFQDYAIMYSACWAGPRYYDYAETLSRLYPDTYQYFTWDNSVKHFGPEFNPEQIMASNKPVYLYLENDTPELLQKTMNKFFEGTSHQPGKLDTLFLNPTSHEIIYELKISRVEPLFSK